MHRLPVACLGSRGSPVSRVASQQPSQLACRAADEGSPSWLGPYGRAEKCDIMLNFLAISERQNDTVKEKFRCIMLRYHALSKLGNQLLVKSFM